MNKSVMRAIALVSCLIATPLFAGVFTPYNGEWKLVELDLPAAVVNGSPSEDFEIVSGDLAISDAGTATFQESGSDEEESAVLMLSEWEFQSLAFLITSDGETEAPLPFIPSASGSFLSHVFKDDYVVALAMAVKSPSDLSLADLEGEWINNFFEFPVETEGAAKQFDAGSTSASVDSGGGVTMEGETIVGAITIDEGGGSFTFQDDEGANQFFINDKKDVAINPNRNQDGLSVLTKTPESLDISDLEGHWQVLEIQAPNVGDFQGLTLDDGEFDVFSDRIVIEASGVVVSDESGGTLTVNEDNTLTFSSNSEGDEDTILSVNASKDLLVAAELEEENDEVNLLLVVRLEPLDSSEADLLDIVRLETGEIEVQWQEASALELFESDDLRYWSLLSLVPDQTTAPLAPSNNPRIFYKAYAESQ